MYDIIIRGGTVIDGTGKPGYLADVAVKDGKIAAIGDLSAASAGKVLDASGLVVAPGFIDAHSHSDTAFRRDSSGAAKLFQGVTTEVSGQCGSSPFPALPERMKKTSADLAEDKDDWYCQSFDAFVKKFEQSGKSMAVNQAILVGHGSLRGGTIGYEDRQVTAEELEQMKTLLRRDLEDGAWGLSLGLEYSPGFFADSEELRELGKVVREFDGLVPCHMRNEGMEIDAAIEELLSVGRASGVHVHISHLKVDNFRVHGRAPEVWANLEKARAEGVNVTADMYPFTASSTNLTIRCPKWSQEGGGSAVVGFLQGPRRQEVIEGIRTHYFNAERAETCLFTGDGGGLWPEIIGKTLRQVAEEFLNTTDYAEAAAEVLIRTEGRAGCIFFVMSEDDMLYFLSKDVGIGSDGYAYSGDPAKVPGKPHPRSFAAIAEFFRLAREHKLCTIEEAVRRVTSKGADMIGMTDRGRLQEGLVADITVFDPATIAPRATYLEPVQLAQGVCHVLVGGGIAMENGVQTDFRGGKFLRKQH
ncbi:MAG: D-aminoacylase [Clostridia bacterium]|nr:D-aminoacylase [Clostridia bacterium]